MLRRRRVVPRGVVDVAPKASESGLIALGIGVCSGELLQGGLGLGEVAGLEPDSNELLGEAGVALLALERGLGVREGLRGIGDRGGSEL